MSLSFILLSTYMGASTLHLFRYDPSHSLWPPSGFPRILPRNSGQTKRIIQLAGGHLHLITWLNEFMSRHPAGVTRMGRSFKTRSKTSSHVMKSRLDEVHIINL